VLCIGAIIPIIRLPDQNKNCAIIVCPNAFKSGT
jgi:hypothetical protein